jgi:hypothetical protein
MPTARTLDATTMRHLLMAIDDTISALAAVPGWGTARGDLAFVRDTLLRAALGDVAVMQTEAA